MLTYLFIYKIVIDLVFSNWQLSFCAFISFQCFPDQCARKQRNASQLLLESCQLYRLRLIPNNKFMTQYMIVSLQPSKNYVNPQLPKNPTSIEQNTFIIVSLNPIKPPTSTTDPPPSPHLALFFFYVSNIINKSLIWVLLDSIFLYKLLIFCCYT